MPEKISEAELTKVRATFTKMDELSSRISKLEVAKLAAAAEFIKVSQKNDEIMKELRDAYGHIEIDVETGEYTKIEEDGVQ